MTIIESRLSINIWWSARVAHHHSTTHRLFISINILFMSTYRSKCECELNAFRRTDVQNVSKKEFEQKFLSMIVKCRREKENCNKKKKQIRKQKVWINGTKALLHRHSLSGYSTIPWIPFMITNFPSKWTDDILQPNRGHG